MSNGLFLVGVALVGCLAGAVASVAGFGIGSLLTPLFSVQLSTKLAVAAVSLPHFLGTLLRLISMRQHVDRRILLGFGLTSAAGGLTGALLQSLAQSPILTGVFGSLLVFAGSMGVLGIDERMRFRGWMAWAAGALSGFLGGLVGNQGGIRSAAMLGFDVPKHAFVATATAVALIVDAARMPVYLFTQGREIAQAWPLVAAAALGVVGGTLVGERILRRVPQSIFRRVVSATILVLGVVMLFRAVR